MLRPSQQLAQVRSCALARKLRLGPAVLFDMRELTIVCLAFAGLALRNSGSFDRVASSKKGTATSRSKGERSGGGGALLVCRAGPADDEPADAGSGREAVASLPRSVLENFKAVTISIFAGAVSGLSPALLPPTGTCTRTAASC